MRISKPCLASISAISVLALTLLSIAPVAKAEGGFSDPAFIQMDKRTSVAEYAGRGHADLSETVTVNVSADGAVLSSTTGAVADASKKAAATAVWDTTTVQT